MNILARLIVTLCLPFIASCTQAQSQTYMAGVDASSFTRAELDQMLAPIALYPDTVLSHLLIAATYPLEVVQADRWAQNNSHLDAQAAVSAVEHKNWDPSVQALVAFPQILERMSDDLDWTQRLGDAFLANEAEVMAVIQDLRQKAYASGNLEKMQHVRVQREKSIIIIEPAVERVVYIPYYDTRVVYGGWWWPNYPPTYWHHPRNHVYVGGVYWGPRAYLGSTFFSTSFHWHQRRVVYVDYRQHRAQRLHTSRKIARFHGAHHWQHNPVHRRGVAYRTEKIRDHYGSPRTSFSKLREQREHDRVGAKRPGVNSSRREATRSDQRRTEGAHRFERTDSRAERLQQRLSNDTAAPKREWRRDELPRNDEKQKRALRSGGDRTEHSISKAERRERLQQNQSTADRSPAGLSPKMDRAARSGPAEREQRRAPQDAAVSRDAEKRSAVLESRRAQVKERKARPMGGEQSDRRTQLSTPIEKQVSPPPRREARREVPTRSTETRSNRRVEQTRQRESGASRSRAGESSGRREWRRAGQ